MYLDIAQAQRKRNAGEVRTRHASRGPASSAAQHRGACKDSRAQRAHATWRTERPLRDCFM